ncbi:MAG: DUF4012 domain-containing protein [bacterium]
MGPKAISKKNKELEPAKVKPIKVRLTSVSEPSPFVIRVTPKTRPAPVVKQKTAPKTGINLLGETSFKPRAVLKQEPVEEDLIFSSRELALLFQNEASSPSQTPLLEDWVPAFRNPFSFKTVAIFAVLSLLFVLPIHAIQQGYQIAEAKNEVMARGQTAFSALKIAENQLKNRNPEAAIRAFQEASLELSQVESLVDANNTLIKLAAALPEGKMAQSGANLVKAVNGTTEIATKITEALSSIGTAGTLTEKIARVDAALKSLEPKIDTIEITLGKVNAKDLPADLPVQQFKDTASLLSSKVGTISKLLTVGQYILGSQEPRRILVVFQNSRELRPTGGFIGSFALIDLKKGQVVKLEVPGGGSYDIRGQLTERVRSPEPLSLINPRFEFQDANWFPDFPTSAQKLMRFYTQSGGPTVDGIIAINSSFLEKLLTIIGPQTIPGLGVEVTSKNFVDIAQQIAQFDYNKEENRPKAFLGALAPVIIKQTTESSSENLVKIAELTSESLLAKDIQIYMRDPETKTLLRELGVDGAQSQTEGDYLSLINTNLGGGKTDQVIQESLDEKIIIKEDGSVEKTIVLTRVNSGDLKNALANINNVTYHRFYVPLGSTLLKASGSTPPPEKSFEIPDPDLKVDPDLLANSEKIGNLQGMELLHEGDYSVFGGWTMIKPGETKTLTLTYRLPFKIQGDQKTWYQKLTSKSSLLSFNTVYDPQSGKVRELKREVVFPKSWNLIWQSGSTSTASTVSNFTLNQTAVRSLLFKY